MKLSQKSLLIIQTSNNLKKLALSLSIHKIFFDQIIILDHNSEKNLMGINIDKVKVYRIVDHNYNLDIYLNYIIYKFDLAYKYDFIFKLDDDEILDQKLYKKIVDNRFNYIFPFIKLYWKNSIFINKNLNDYYLSKERSVVYKKAINTKKVKNFYIIHGAHDIYINNVYTKKFYNIFESKNEIYHLPFFDEGEITFKLKRNNDNFLNKINECYPYIKNKINSELFYNYKFPNNEELFHFIHNYRIRNLSKHKKVNFVKSDILSLNNESFIDIYESLKKLNNIEVTKFEKKKENKFKNEYNFFRHNYLKKNFKYNECINYLLKKIKIINNQLIYIYD